MAKRSKHSFIKFQKELERKKKAKEKLERKQGKKDQEINVRQFVVRRSNYEVYIYCGIEPAFLAQCF